MVNLALDYYELLALHRAIIEAKFGHACPADTDILGSPLLANVANRVVQLLIDLETERGDKSASFKWEKWRQLSPSRKEWALILQRAHNCPKWSEWTLDDRGKFLDCLASPFIFRMEDRRELLSAGAD